MQSARRAGALLAGAVALGALALVLVAWQSPALSGDGVVELEGKTATSAKLIARLDKILRKKLASARGRTATIQAEKELQAAKKQMHIHLSKAQQLKAACEDGEPCGAKSEMPIMKYIPSTGDWDVVSAGNPDVVWHSLFSRAKSRDEMLKRERAEGKAVVTRNDEAPNEKKARLVQLMQVDSEESHPGERKQLEAKLKSLLKARLGVSAKAQGQAMMQQLPSSPSAAPATVPILQNDPHQVNPARFIDSSDDASSDTVDTIKQLSDDLRNAKQLVEHGDHGDRERMQNIEARLADTDQIHDICEHRILAHRGLGVLKSSSLWGCERQLRRRMAEARGDLKRRITQLTFSGSDSGNTHVRFNGDLASHEEKYQKLRAKQSKLSHELSTLRKDHADLTAEMHQQKETIDQLTDKRIDSTVDKAPVQALHQVHRRSAAPVPQGIPPGYKGKLTAAMKAWVRKEKELEAARKVVPKVKRNTWAPPVPPGLPPKYNGPLLFQGSSDVPTSRPPGA